MSDHGRLLGVFAGPVAPLGPRGVPSAFVKQRLPAGGRVAELGLEGDAQADLTVHGGADKAVYAYPSEHYPEWLREFPDHESLWRGGALGENLSLSGLREGDVRIGDVFSVGTAVLQVTQPRKPCFKLGLRFNDQRIAASMVRAGRTGWYLRVLVPGRLAEGDELLLLERPHPDWTIARINGAAYDLGTSDDVLRSISMLPELSAAWRSQTDQALSANAARKLPRGFRPFVLVDNRRETATVSSLTFSPADGMAIASHEPGQHVQVRLPPTDGAEPPMRRYTISSVSDPKTIRISIKRQEGGTFSQRLQALEVGSKVELSPPQGRFVLDRAAGRPIVLISAGVGITPMIAMLNAAVVQDGRYVAIPKILFVHQARDRSEHAFAPDIETIAAKHSHVSSRTFYSRADSLSHPSEHVVVGRRLTGSDLENLPPDADYYLCGPSGFMAEVRGVLTAQGVAPRRIRAEIFVSGDGGAPLSGRLSGDAAGLDRAVVSFKRSGRVVEWRPQSGTVLDLAEAAGIDVPSSCRIGLCGTCLTRILDGKVEHVGQTGVDPDDAEALVCSALPASELLVLDL